MPINFHDEKNRFSYTMRQADSSWVNAIRDIVDVKDKQVLDIGCGGGIYCMALIEMGAVHVTGIDYSVEGLKGAQQNCSGYSTIDFMVGNALNTGLSDAQADIILERALIHHLALNELGACFVEAYRLLKPGGMLIVQDRTPVDCLQPGSTTNIRGYFFDRFPRLKDAEIARRRESKDVINALLHAGFKGAEERKLWETRAIYPHSDALLADIQGRSGRSILHELTDEELRELVNYIRQQFKDYAGEEIYEQDCWTIWSGVK
jgi:ubiquinone/menaquinone biosynthesis C-methylase UbiE